MGIDSSQHLSEEEKDLELIELKTKYEEIETIVLDLTKEREILIDLIKKNGIIYNENINQQSNITSSQKDRTYDFESIINKYR